MTGLEKNPEQKVDTGKRKLNLTGHPKSNSFFSNLTGGENVDAGWELITIESPPKSAILATKTQRYTKDKIVNISPL